MGDNLEAMKEAGMEEKPKIKNFYVWQSGMVMVFDQYGKQMPDLQGPWEEKKEQIERAVKEAPWQVESVFNAKWR